jgi:hypothetical protein
MWRYRLVSGLAVALLAATTLTACSPTASKGTMPPPGPDGEIDPAAAPDFIAGAGDVDIAGYARREDVLAMNIDPFPVFGEDLRTVVGQMVPGNGFVPAGVDPATVPDRPVEAGPSGDLADATVAGHGEVTLYVRNGGQVVAWIALQIGGRSWNSTGFWGENMGVGCYAMPSGSRLVLLDRSPEQPGASVLQAIHTRGPEPEPPSLWIDIAEDGSVLQGVGTPAWWGEPQTC